MTPTLTRRGRALLLFLSAAGYTAWFSGLGERSDAAGGTATSPAGIATPRRAPLPDIRAVIARDPFAGAPGHRRAPSSETRGADPDLAGDAAPQSNAGRAGAVVPDIAGLPSAAIATAATPALVLRATIVGRNPVAYVENGTAMDIVRVGDTLGDARVTHIDLDGVTFADGRRLELPGLAGATQPAQPAPKSASIAERLEAIRKLLAHMQQPATQSAAPPAPVASPPADYPTPAPLRTVDSRGIPVGVNPTPDLGEPTAFPYPYPYAPRR